MKGTKTLKVPAGRPEIYISTKELGNVELFFNLFGGCSRHILTLDYKPETEENQIDT